MWHDDFKINADVLGRYRLQLQSLKRQWNLSEIVPVEALLLLPGVVDDSSGSPADVGDHWPVIGRTLEASMENLAHMRRIQAAAESPGFFGDLRRAIIASHLSVGELSAATGVDQRLLSDFRAGDAELPAAALERLVDALGLRLMQEIPR